MDENLLKLLNNSSDLFIFYQNDHIVYQNHDCSLFLLDCLDNLYEDYEKKLIYQLEKLSFQDGKSFFVLEHYKNITDLYNRAKCLEFDCLTQLPNRSVIQEKLAELSTGTKQGYIVMIDIDNFKIINDSLGHIVGDDILKEMAKILLETFNSNNFVGRYGGDEFLAIIYDSDDNCVLSQLNDLKNEIINHFKEEVDIIVSVSIGSAYYNGEDSLLVVLEQADKALYQSKKEGKNNIVIFNK